MLNIKPINKRQLAASVALIMGLFFFTPEINTPAFDQAGGLEFLVQTDQQPQEDINHHSLTINNSTHNIVASAPEQTPEPENNY